LKDAGSGLRQGEALGTLVWLSGRVEEREAARAADWVGSILVTKKLHEFITLFLLGVRMEETAERESHLKATNLSQR